MMKEIDNLKVSIVIPAYNEEKNIEKTLKSLLNQTYKNVEIVVVDNNSKDRTKEIASKYANTITETKQGYIYAVKRGISETDGEILTICDADSFYPSKWLEKMVRSFNNDRVVAVYGSAEFYDTGKFMALISIISYSLFLIISKLFDLDNTAGFNFLFRRDAYEKVGGYDENWKWGSPDIEFGRRLRKMGKVRLSLIAVKTSSRRFKKGGFFKTTRMFLSMWRKMLKNEKPTLSYKEYNQNRR